MIFKPDDVNKRCIHLALETGRVQLYGTQRIEIERLEWFARSDVVGTHDCPRRIVTAGDADARYQQHQQLRMASG